jgi:hypothetical protein
MRAVLLQMLLAPVVFIGGKLVGRLERLMAKHIAGELLPIASGARHLDRREGELPLFLMWSACHLNPESKVGSLQIERVNTLNWPACELGYLSA